MQAIVALGPEGILHLLLEVDHLVAIHLVEGARAEDVSAGRAALVIGDWVVGRDSALHANIDALRALVLPEVCRSLRAGVSQAFP